MEVLWHASYRITTPLQAYYLAPLHRLSADPTLARLFEAMDPGRLRVEAATLIEAFPRALDLRLLPQGWEGTDADVHELGYPILDTLRQAEASHLRPPAEARFLDGQRHPQITLVQPVLSPEGAVVGHVVLFLPWDAVQETWKGSELRGGYLELQQGGRMVLARLGDALLKTVPTPYQLAVENTCWTLAYWAPSLPTSSIPWFAVAVAAGLLLGLGAFWIGRRKAADRREPLQEIAAPPAEPVDLFLKRMKQLQEQSASQAAPLSPGPAPKPPPPERAGIEPVMVLDAQPEAHLSVDEIGLALDLGSAASHPVSSSAAIPSPLREDKRAEPLTIDIRLYDVSPEEASGCQQAAPATVLPEQEQPVGLWSSEPSPDIDWEVSSGKVFELGPPTAAQLSQSGLSEVPWCPVVPTSLSLSATLFGPYAVHGIPGTDLTSEMAYHIGQAIGSEAAYRGMTQLVVGYDGRLPSKTLAQALAGGLVSAGIRVMDVGMVPTPVLYFAAHHLGIRSGIMVTGSDNAMGPSEIRIALDGEDLTEEALQALHQRIASGDLRQGDGGRERLEILPAYLDRITSTIRLARQFKLVVDCGNGVASTVAPRLFRAMGCEVLDLFCEVDGKFSHHPPDPSNPENLQALVRAVREHRADLGLAFDGDGDRLGVIDEQGNVVFLDRQMMLYATDVLARNPGASFVYDVKCTANLGRVITQHRGHAVSARAGAVPLRARMREVAALLAGDTHGHILFRERWYGFSDALYAGARLLRILARIPGTASDAFTAFPVSIIMPEFRVKMPESKAPDFMQSLIKLVPSLEKERFAGASISTVDGLRVDFNDRSVLLQVPEPGSLLSIRFEALTSQALQRVQGEVRELLRESAPGLELPF
jgi:phosphomannomutase